MITLYSVTCETCGREWTRAFARRDHAESVAAEHAQLYRHAATVWLTTHEIQTVHEPGGIKTTRQ